MKTKTFEKELPASYAPVFSINAKDKKVGIIFNLIALVIMVLTVGVGLIPLLKDGFTYTATQDLATLLFPLLLMVSMLIYIVLHELVHGIAYKALTGEKLTFGISWSCAFCGVPGIYTYRKTALVALLAPFLVFDVVFVLGAILLYFANPLYYFGALLLLGLHIGGCSGDLYVTLLFLFRYRDPKTLMRDTGPEQTFYIPQ
ncbi:MAG: DUF3267 domain-containing protein [Clostridia bacterium]|nr:DUF3267 domain-containing protein [Clostridia bacterium]